ncbi:MAG: SUMO ligase siz1 [Phylliscum demangeonii]|nr:MAG: SUMO ligase siz1 [Phylliscum demangeonii]
MASRTDLLAARLDRVPTPRDLNGSIHKIRSLLNRHLVAILKELRLPHTGVKAIMQTRLIQYLEGLEREGKRQEFWRLRDLVHSPESAVPPASSRYHVPLSPALTPPSIGSGGMPSFAGYQPISSSYPANLVFKPSPFFTVLETLMPVQHCTGGSHPRHASATLFRLRKDVIDRLNADASLKVMLYGTVEGGSARFGTINISFPPLTELKINGDDVKANFKGAKSTPGSTPPADITKHLRRLESFENVISLSYGQVPKQVFSYVINLVKPHPIEDLVDTLKIGNVVSREKVVQEMVTQAQDTDIVTTSTVMSLKCPISTLRIDLPCRSMVCSHNQCFDAASFLQIQLQLPKWSCPICYKTVSFEGLVVDQYLMDILEKTPKSVDQVTIEPDGQWSLKTVLSTPAPSSGNQSRISHHLDDDDDDDLREVQSNIVVRHTPLGPGQDLGLSASQPTSNKRGREALIDLTLSDDEPDTSYGPDHARPSKRPPSVSTATSHMPPPHTPIPLHIRVGHPNGSQLPTPVSQ